MTGDTHTESREQLPGQRSGCDARGGFARARAFEYVADIGVSVLDRAGKIRMPRTRTRHVGPFAAGRAFWRLGLDVHRLLPVHPVAIPDEERDRRASGHAMTNAAKDLRAVALDLHASATSVAALPPTQLRVERIDVEGQTGRHAVEGDDERLPMRLAGGEKPKHSSPFYTTTSDAYSRATRTTPGSGLCFLVLRKLRFSASAAFEETAIFGSPAPRIIERIETSSRLHLQRHDSIDSRPLFRLCDRTCVGPCDRRDGERR